MDPKSLDSHKGEYPIDAMLVYSSEMYQADKSALYALKAASLNVNIDSNSVDPTYAAAQQRFMSTVTDIMNTPLDEMPTEFEVAVESFEATYIKLLPAEVRNLVTPELINTLDDILNKCNCDLWELDIISLMIWLNDVNDFNIANKYK